MQCDNSTPDISLQVISLVKKARAGDRAAFAQLISLFWEDVFRLVYYRTRSSMDAEDLTQEIFLRAFRNILRLKEVDRFRPWLFRIAVNRVRDFHRKKRFQSLFSHFEDHEDSVTENGACCNPVAEDKHLKNEFWDHVNALMNKLSAGEREVFILRFMDQLQIKEISEVLKKRESTVKTHLYRAIRKFKKESSLLQLLREGIE
jgi:RNA polymerase sigma-70 factor (ECF subfamily)